MVILALLLFEVFLLLLVPPEGSTILAWNACSVKISETNDFLVKLKKKKGFTLSLFSHQRNKVRIFLKNLQINCSFMDVLMDLWVLTKQIFAFLFH